MNQLIFISFNTKRSKNTSWQICSLSVDDSQFSFTSAKFLFSVEMSAIWSQLSPNCLQYLHQGT